MEICRGSPLTIITLLLIRQLVVQNQVFDALLFLPVGLLLSPHGNGKARIRRQINSTSLEIVSIKPRFP